MVKIVIKQGNIEDLKEKLVDILEQYKANKVKIEFSDGLFF